MIVLGFDTATPATAIGLRLADGRTIQARDDPGRGDRPGHATRLLGLAATLLGEAGLRWRDVERIAVGVGPGTFTGLRIGVATARGLAQSLGAELVGVSSLRALTEPADGGGAPVLAAIDGRRGEVFVAAYAAGEELMSPSAVSPADLESVLEQIEGRPRAVGDGAVRYRGCLERIGAAVPKDSSPLHRISGAAICDIALSRAPEAIDAVLPDYCRRPDAEIALERVAASGGNAE